MPSLTANPTPITPPRCSLIDERTGLIAREWYMFFLSLFRNVTDLGQYDATSPDVSSELASYDAALRALANQVDVVPPADQLDAALQLLAAQTNIAPSPDVYDDKITELQQQIYAVESTPPEVQVIPSAYAALLDSVTVQTSLAGVGSAIVFNGVTIFKGFSQPAYTQVAVYVSGLYNVTLQAQFYNASAASDFVYLWLKRNSVNTALAQTLTVPALSGGVNGSIRGNVSFMLYLFAGDILEAYWQNTTGAAFISPVTPSTVIPGAMLTIDRIYT